MKTISGIEFASEHNGTDVFRVIELAYEQGRKDGHSEQLGTNLAEVGTDCISREQAIDAVRKSYDAILDFESDGHTVADSFEDIINALPSAQPEITHEQAVEYLQSKGWMQNHDLQMMLDGVHRFTAQPEPCEDAVSRQAAIDGLNDAVHEHNITDFDAVATILALPSVTPKRRTGEWIDGIISNDGGGLPVIVCDQCNTFFPLQFGDGHNFCPNCGADMREKGENSESN